jgi:hypothetical protein
MPRLLIALALMSFALAAVARGEPATKPFAIHLIDEKTGRGVPLVYLTTTYKQTYVTDSNGYVAFDEPGLMTGDEVWFDIKSYGYESPVGLLDYHGVALKPTAGGAAEVKLKRSQIAERLYRLTGFGIYRDTIRLGKKAPIVEPLLNARVAGQDTVQTAVYRGKYRWFWQDTDRMAFALGCFSMTGAVANALPDKIDPDRGIDFTYFVAKPGEFARAMADVPRDGNQPIWVDGLIVTKDRQGNEKMIARYVASNTDFSHAETGLVIYNDERERFERLKKFDGTGEHQLAPSGRGYRFVDAGKAYVGFIDGVRVEDTFETSADPAAYEVFTCLKADGGVDRADGKLRWHWQRGGKRLDKKTIRSMVDRKQLAEAELPERLRDVETGKPINMANGSIAWNAYLKRWTLLFTQSRGDSELGEVWFATANSPQGPWVYARKVATHAMPKNNNSFYNPIQHEDLSREGGRVIYFEGTFVTTFSGNDHPTPLYDYNQMMYRIDLGDERMKFSEAPAGLTHVEPVVDSH